MYKVWNCDLSDGIYATIQAINKSGEYIISTVVVDRTVMIITQEPEQLQEWTLENTVDA
jgi:hypothetical protein